MKSLLKLDMQGWAAILLFSGTMLYSMFGAAPAEAKEWEWIPPDEFTDNSPLVPADDLSEYRLYCNNNPEIVDTFAPTATSGVTTFPQGSTNTCHLRAVDLDGSESAASNSVNFTEPDKTPSAPTALQ